MKTSLKTGDIIIHWVSITAIIIICVGLLYTYLKKSYLCLVLIISNVMIFALYFATQSSLRVIVELGFNPQYFFTGANLYTIITSLYVHASIGHILFNMIALLFFGLTFEEKIGTLAFGIIYFSCGVAAIIAYALTNSFAPSILVGASGAICGIIGAFARLYPMQRMIIIAGFVPLPPLPLIVWAGIFLILQLFLALSSTAEFGTFGSNIAYTAHIGGFLFGFLTAPFVSKIVLEKKVFAAANLDKIATTPFLKELVEKIKCEDSVEIQRTWLQQFALKSCCPVCKHGWHLKGRRLICSRCGYKIRLDK